MSPDTFPKMISLVLILFFCMGCIVFKLTDANADGDEAKRFMISVALISAVAAGVILLVPLEKIPDAVSAFLKGKPITSFQMFGS